MTARDPQGKPPKLPGALLVLLSGQPVGRLTRQRDNYVEFAFRPDYIRHTPRPILSQSFEDDLQATERRRVRLMPFFSNLLPEGALRTLVAEQYGLHPEHEFAMLLALGEDLPGAVTVVADRDAAIPADQEPDPTQPTHAGPEPLLKFSLAGVQLKFSMMEGRRGLTLPGRGQDGDWIVKLPDERAGAPEVPRNEYTTMRWAEGAGIDIPAVRLVPVAALHGLPKDLALREDTAYAVRRFDRSPAGRIHSEDFAQVLGRYSAEKYSGASYETLAGIVLALCGTDGLWELLRRLVFLCACGNGDAHLKNWSLRYPDGVRAALAPAYDLVSTIQYIKTDGLALNLARSKRWEDVTVASFRRLHKILARRLPTRVPAEADLLRQVDASVAAVRAAWAQLPGVTEVPPAYRARIEAHLATVPLFRAR